MYFQTSTNIAGDDVWIGKPSILTFDNMSTYQTLGNNIYKFTVTESGKYKFNLGLCGYVTPSCSPITSLVDYSLRFYTISTDNPCPNSCDDMPGLTGKFINAIGNSEC